MNKRWMKVMSSALFLYIGFFMLHAMPAQEGAKRIEVVASKFSYSPGEITLKKGQPVILVVKTADVSHGLRFRDLDLNTKAEKGTPGELAFTPQKTGTFVGHCSVFCGSGHGEMTLTLHVVE